MGVMLYRSRAGRQRIVKQVHDVLIHGALVGFERQHILAQTDDGVHDRQLERLLDVSWIKPEVRDDRIERDEHIHLGLTADSQGVPQRF